jgi:FkbM family methyltransferase
MKKPLILVLALAAGLAACREPARTADAAPAGGAGQHVESPAMSAVESPAMSPVESPAMSPVESPAMSAAERSVFEKKLGPGHFSAREEEWLIRDYFQDRRGGVFVDVGANHYKVASKTYYLESKLGWSGIAIEPQQEFAAEYAKYRPRTKFLPFFISDASNHTARLYLRRHKDQVASSDEAFVKSLGGVAEVRDVPTMTLDDVLDSEGISRIDFLSMDIELDEPEAQAGFDIVRFRPSLVCIEGLLPVRQKILDYFAAHGYVLIGKYMWVDLENLYFEPRPATRPPS